MKRVSILLLVVFTFVLSVQWMQARSKPYYTVQDLGTLGGTYASPGYGGVNTGGWVSGYSYLTSDLNLHALVWRRGVMTDLGTFGGPNSQTAWGRSSERGDTAGLAETATPDPNGEDWCGFGTYLICLPFLWQNGVMTPLPILGGLNGTGLGMNSLDQVVGLAENTTPCPPNYPVGMQEPVIWENRQVRQLPNYSGDAIGSARAINDWGQIVGWSGPCSGRLHSLLWDRGKPVNLGDLGGGVGYGPIQINDWGQVVGQSVLPDGVTDHAFLWQNGVMLDLGALPGDVWSTSFDVNNWGVVVGGSVDAEGNERGFIWRGGGMTDLNTLIEPNSPLYLVEADGINDWGQIVGQAVVLSTGNVDIFLATPNYGDGTRKGAAILDGSEQRPKPNLPENVRKLLRQRRETLSGSNRGGSPLR